MTTSLQSSEKIKRSNCTLFPKTLIDRKGLLFVLLHYHVHVYNSIAKNSCYHSLIFIMQIFVLFQEQIPNFNISLLSIWVHKGVNQIWSVALFVWHFAGITLQCNEYALFLYIPFCCQSVISVHHYAWADGRSQRGVPGEDLHSHVKRCLLLHFFPFFLPLTPTRMKCVELDRWCQSRKVISHILLLPRQFPQWL